MAGINFLKIFGLQLKASEAFEAAKPSIIAVATNYVNQIPDTLNVPSQFTDAVTAKITQATNHVVGTNPLMIFAVAALNLTIVQQIQKIATNVPMSSYKLLAIAALTKAVNSAKV